MDDSLIRFFAPHTQEEESLLRGEPLAQGRYTDRSAFIVEGERFVPSRQMISLRPHTRFADFPMHWHDYVEMMYIIEKRRGRRIPCKRPSWPPDMPTWILSKPWKPFPPATGW